MPHIRLVVSPEWEGLYINGTSVKQDEVVRARDIISILKDNLGYDAEVYQYEDMDKSQFENHLRDFPMDKIPLNDRI
jgi:hypothetical protein